MENRTALSITGIDKLDSNPMFLMGFTYKQFRAKVSHELSEASGISLEMFGAIKVLNTHGQMTQQELSDLLLRNRSVTKRLVDNAIKLNLIAASKSETNKKVKLLALTDEGQAVMLKCSPIVNDISQQFQSSLTKDESQQLTQLLAKLINMDEFVD
ncbi:MarR family winged helix-turn-helix transcriptional regulator [Vibrio gallicus]|uniref:MarR family winged helix-turn-helix transcriptional regulator n=1 Tax=Vibrio gallicus TaxID=190897 RepID=UPI0021C26C1E|nr:MarR family winged helix-turn-helix transcriptional regulator [Vibrio gallicus]